MGKNNAKIPTNIISHYKYPESKVTDRLLFVLLEQIFNLYIATFDNLNYVYIQLYENLKITNLS